MGADFTYTNLTEATLDRARTGRTKFDHAIRPKPLNDEK
jgi:hypothetical protein